MTSQQDTELSRILDKYAEHYFNEVEGFKSNHTLTKVEAIQALTSWKDKEVEAARLDENNRYMDMLKTGKWRSFATEVDDRIKSLQSQGGKNE